MILKSILSAGIKKIPGINFLYRMMIGRKFLKTETGGTNSARYSYSVWLRHLVMANKNGLPTQLNSVAELGPGDSIGSGLTALLTGTNTYYALDVKRYSNIDRNNQIFEELIKMIRDREDIPNESEFPSLKPSLDSYKFPSLILTDDRIQRALSTERIKSIRNAILNINEGISSNIHVSYIVPWDDFAAIKKESMDMIFSQAVMEHVSDLDFTYDAFDHWVKPGGFISHQIDFKCHGTAIKWNGHWTYSDFQWNLIKGKRSWLINRQPYSKHNRLMKKYGFDAVCEIKIKDSSGFARKKLATNFKHLTDDDLITSGIFYQAVKKTN